MGEEETEDGERDLLQRRGLAAPATAEGLGRDFFFFLNSFFSFSC